MVRDGVGRLAQVSFWRVAARDNRNFYRVGGLGSGFVSMRCSAGQAARGATAIPAMTAIARAQTMTRSVLMIATFIGAPHPRRAHACNDGHPVRAQVCITPTALSLAGGPRPTGRMVPAVR